MKRTFSVPRINCDGCVRTVTETLKSVSGVTAAEADALKKTVDVVFDPAAVTEERLRQALLNLGCPAANEGPFQAYGRRGSCCGTWPAGSPRRWTRGRRATP